MHIHDFPSAEDWEWEDGEEPIQGSEIAKAEVIHSRGQQIGFLSFIFKEE